LLNGGHECLVVRVFDPIMDAVSPDQFSAAADRHIAQRNIAVVPAASPASIVIALNLGYLPEAADAEVEVVLEDQQFSLVLALVLSCGPHAFRHFGDGACLVPLFDRYAERLCALVHRVDHDGSRVEDCGQETFRRAIEELDQFDESREGRSCWAWLMARAMEHPCHNSPPKAILLWSIAPRQEGKLGRRV
jgi:hypothetical protein